MSAAAIQRPTLPITRTRLPSLASLAAAVLVLALLPACETLRFYSQAVAGQASILARGRSNASILADPTRPAELRQRLASVERLRHFATTQLALPGKSAYGLYADLGREHVVWVLYAAPEFSLEPLTWRYPVLGKLDYRGFFSEREAETRARDLRRQGFDVFVGGVDAYSTLGWFHDPILNTFIGYPELDLAETLFHELAHHRVFRNGDTAFNEAMASIVAEEGVQRWLIAQGRDHELGQYRQRLVKRAEFNREIERARDQLAALYASAAPAERMRQQKAAIMGDLRRQFQELHRRWGGRGLEGWLNMDINNGHLVSICLYADRMPGFRRLLAECDGDFERFFRRCEHAEVPPVPANPLPSRDPTAGSDSTPHTEI